MIQTASKLKEYLEYEKKIYCVDRHPLKQWYCHEHNYYIWKYVKWLRIEEYLMQHKNRFIKVLKYYARRKKNILGEKMGLTIGTGVFESGLTIWHYGSIVVNGNCKIGKNCVLHGQNCIGNRGGDVYAKAPVIGSNVDIGVGASIIGDVYIADDVKIGAGAVVVKSCYNKGATLIGVPANEK